MARTRHGQTRAAAQRLDLAVAYLGIASVDEVRLHRVIEAHIRRVLDAADGNLSTTAKLLGMHRRSLQRYLRRVESRRRRRRRV